MKAQHELRTPTWADPSDHQDPSEEDHQVQGVVDHLEVLPLEEVLPSGVHHPLEPPLQDYHPVEEGLALLHLQAVLEGEAHP